MLNTAQKIALAAAVSRIVVRGRRAFGKPPEDDFVRNGIRWRLDLREGIDFSIFLLGAFEPSTVRAYARIVKSGDTVLDIGANIGAHALPLARLVGERGRVIAFEPTSFALRKCAANIALNPGLSGRIALHQVMLVENDGGALPAAIFSSWPLVEDPQLHATHRGKLMDTGGARAATLDRMMQDLGLSAVDFIKLDVDGHEYSVLAGAKATLRKSRPTIALELAPYIHAEQGHTFEEVIALLVGMGYAFRDIRSLQPLSADPAALRARIPRHGSMNVLATPS